MSTAHCLAGVGFIPDIVIAREFAARNKGVRPPGNAFRAPDMRQPEDALAVEVPVGFAKRHGGVDLVERDLRHVERLQQAKFCPQKVAVYGR